MKQSPTREINKKDWLKEAEEKFGKNTSHWEFICPSCNCKMTVRDWKEVGASEGEIAFSCIGRHKNENNNIFSKENNYCNYAGGGLFRLNPVHIVLEDGSIRETFEFSK